MTHKAVAIIPARGGSKGVLHKNRRDVAGLPLISYTLRAARAATCLDRIIVSTDESEIADIARQEGAEVLMRPADIAGDESPVIEAVRHALEEIERKDGFTADAMVLLQPTSPFRTGADIDAAIALFRSNDATPVCSVYRCEDNHPARMYEVQDGHLRSLFPELAAVRRQDLPPIYHRNGAIYVFGKREVAMGRIIVEDMIPYVMPFESSVNIDTELDLLLMKAIVERAHEDTTA